jgi:hypothetical protein
MERVVACNHFKTQSVGEESSPTFWVLLSFWPDSKKKSPEFDHNNAVRGRNGCMQPLQDSERRRGQYVSSIWSNMLGMCTCMCVRACAHLWVCTYIYEWVLIYMCTYQTKNTNTRMYTCIPHDMTLKLSQTMHKSDGHNTRPPDHHIHTYLHAYLLNRPTQYKASWSSHTYIPTCVSLK